MSVPPVSDVLVANATPRRDRARRRLEPAVLAQEDRAARGICVTLGCGKSTEGTRRCRDCERRIDANSERYRGKGSRGRTGGAALDRVDIEMAAKSIGNARGVAVESSDASFGAMTLRQREEYRRGILEHVSLAKRFLVDIERRHGAKPEDDAAELAAADREVNQEHERQTEASKWRNRIERDAKKRSIQARVERSQRRRRTKPLAATLAPTDPGL